MNESLVQLNVLTFGGRLAGECGPPGRGVRAISGGPRPVVGMQRIGDDGAGDHERHVGNVTTTVKAVVDER